MNVIRWAQEAWKEVTGTTIKNCFEKCGIIKNDDLIEIKEEDLGFEASHKVQQTTTKSGLRASIT